MRESGNWSTLGFILGNVLLTTGQINSVFIKIPWALTLLKAPSFLLSMKIRHKTHSFVKTFLQNTKAIFTDVVNHQVIINRSKVNSWSRRKAFEKANVGLILQRDHWECHYLLALPQSPNMVKSSNPIRTDWWITTATDSTSA